MQIIDTHVHVWTHAPEYPLSLVGNYVLPAYDARPNDLLETMAQHNVQRAVLVHHIAHGWDNRYAALIRRTYPSHFMAVCRVNPEDPNAPDHLSDLTENQGFHGVRLSPDATNDDDWFTGPLMLPLFRRANELNIPVLILTQSARLNDLGTILEKIPETCVVIDHMADCARGSIQAQEQLLALAKYPNVYLKMSHVSTHTSDEDLEHTKKFLMQVCDTFGVSRIMWGSDWPLILKSMTYPQVISNVSHEMDFLTSDDLEWIYRKTALKIWSFPDLDTTDKE